MHMNGQSLLVVIVVGIVAGWLAGLIVRGGGMGVIGNVGVRVVQTDEDDVADRDRPSPHRRHRPAVATGQQHAVRTSFDPCPAG